MDSQEATMLGLRLTLAMAFGAAAFAPAALGQTATTYGGMSLDRYDPAARGSDWFELDSLDLRGNLRFAAGLTLDFADQPLVEHVPSGGANTALVSDQLFAHVGASVVLWNRVRFDLSLPIALQQSGTSVTLAGESYPAPTGAALGDLRLGGDVRLFGQRGDAVTGAIGLSAYLPTGSPTAWTGDGSVAIGPHFLLAGEGDWWAYAWRLAFVYRSNQSLVDGIPTGSVLQGGVSVGLKAVDGKLLIGPEFYGETGVGSGQSLFDYDTTPAEVVLGIHYRIGQFVLGLAGGPGLTQAFGTPTFRGLFSFDWAPLPVLDRDHDGIPDNVDACPDTPGVASDDPKLNGCPPLPPPDRDHDGIPDAVDACPDTPGVANDDPKKNGCPPPPPDRDNDGIPDSVDACPDTPGVPSDDPKKNGCPLPPPDRDHDGIPDDVDACPDTPGVPSDDPKKNGCPLDTDGDGVPDSEDNCPTVPGPASNHGCPITKKQLVVIRADKIEILQKVFFKTAKATIQKRSFELLDQVAEVLKTHPNIAHVQVEGHTDTVGKPAKNQILSQARADSVKAYLVKQGVEEERLTAKGFGQDRPIETNSTSAGRANNRRVEFNILPASGAQEPAVVPLQLKVE